MKSATIMVCAVWSVIWAFAATTANAQLVGTGPRLGLNLKNQQTTVTQQPSGSWNPSPGFTWGGIQRLVEVPTNFIEKPQNGEGFLKDDKKSVVIKWQAHAKGTAAFAIIESEDGTSYRRVIQARSGSRQVSLSIKALSPGWYTVTVAVYTPFRGADGKIVYFFPSVASVRIYII
jgi:hypothetical protein